MSTTHRLTAANGTTFVGRLVFPGDGYGRDGTGPVAHDGTQPMIEFFDYEYPHTEFGQFTGGRYNLDTFMAGDTGRGLRLNGDSHRWSLDGESFEEFRGWARAVLVERAVRAMFAAYLGDPDTHGKTPGPSVMQDGDRWSVVWEDGAPYEWSYLASGGGVDEEMVALGEEFGYTPPAYEPVEVPGVFVEPVNHLSLGVYAA